MAVGHFFLCEYFFLRKFRFCRRALSSSALPRSPSLCCQHRSLLFRLCRPFNSLLSWAQDFPQCLPSWFPGLSRGLLPRQDAINATLRILCLGWKRFPFIPLFWPLIFLTTSVTSLSNLSSVQWTGLAGVDRAFRKHTATTCLTDWSIMNSQLFNFHSAGAAARNPKERVSSTTSEPRGSLASQVVCRSWNNRLCTTPFPPCHFAHKCICCAGSHCAHDCPGSPHSTSSSWSHLRSCSPVPSPDHKSKKH